MPYGEPAKVEVADILLTLVMAAMDREPDGGALCLASGEAIDETSEEVTYNGLGGPATFALRMSDGSVYRVSVVEELSV